eukprot:5918106-Prymnesium_polylepis.1
MRVRPYGMRWRRAAAPHTRARRLHPTAPRTRPPAAGVPPVAAHLGIHDKGTPQGAEEWREDSLPLRALRLLHAERAGAAAAHPQSAAKRGHPHHPRLAAVARGPSRRPRAPVGVRVHARRARARLRRATEGGGSGAHP